MSLPSTPGAGVGMEIPPAGEMLWIWITAVYVPDPPGPSLAIAVRSGESPSLEGLPRSQGGWVPTKHLVSLPWAFEFQGHSLLSISACSIT